MTLTRRLTLAALFAVSVTLAACGGSGGDFFAGGGVTGTGITFGSVTGFGSIIANERVHETTAVTQFVRNGDDTAIQDDFRVGDVVVIEWESDDGGLTREATRVSYQRELFGEVTANPDETSGTIGVLGQVVRADATTIFDDFPLAPLPGDVFPEGLVTGNCLEVTGFRDSSGVLFATRIEFEGATCADPVELRGVIDSIGPGNTIEVSGTTVDVENAVITPDGTTLEVDQSVEVVGSFGTGNVLNADTVEVRDDDLSGLEDDDADVEGIVANLSGFDPNFSFELSGITVTTDGGTVYEGGDATNLADVNVRVEAEGTFSSGVLRADKVKFKLDGSINMETVVFLADGATGDVTLDYGAETLLVLTDPLTTQLRDKTDNFDPFGVGNLSPGDYVKIAAFLDGTDIVASKLELEELAGPTVDEDRVLQGPITDLSGRPSSIEILGVTISTASLSACEDETGAILDCSDLVSGLTLNDIVQAQGEDVGGVIIWDELELED